MGGVDLFVGEARQNAAQDRYVGAELYLEAEETQLRRKGINNE